jgi:DNA-binding transcriptional LysR family regulator
MYNHQLDVFVAAAESGSISAAARNCFVTPSAVSQQIAAMESRYGVKLFKRSTRGLQLTAAGEYLLARAREIIEASTCAVSRAQALERRSVVVVTDRVVHSFMCAVVDEYRLRHPASDVQLVLSRSEHPLEDVLNGEADVCPYGWGEGVRSSGLEFAPLLNDREYCVVSRHSRLASLSEVRPDDLVGMEVYMPLPGYADASDALYEYARSLPGLTLKRRTGIDEGFFVQMLAANPEAAAIRLGHHMTAFPELVAVPFHSFVEPVVGIAYGRLHGPATDDFLAVARSLYPAG